MKGTSVSLPAVFMLLTAFTLPAAPGDNGLLRKAVRGGLIEHDLRPYLKFSARINLPRGVEIKNMGHGVLAISKGTNFAIIVSPSSTESRDLKRFKKNILTVEDGTKSKMIKEGKDYLFWSSTNRAIGTGYSFTVRRDLGGKELDCSNTLPFGMKLKDVQRMFLACRTFRK